MASMPAVHAVSQRWTVLRDAARTQLWPLPLLAVVVAVLAGLVLPLLDASVADDWTFLFDGGPEAARSLLVAVAGSLITVTALTFSLTVVTLQLASSQFSPRLLRTFTADRVVQGTLALLLATFIYSITVLRSVRSATADHGEFVPQLSVTVAYVLTVASVLALVGFLAHLVREIRVDTMLRNVHREASLTLSAVFPDAGEPDPDVLERPRAAAHLTADGSGFVTFIDEAALLKAAVTHDACLIVDRVVGDNVVAGTPIGRAWVASGIGGLSGDGLADLQQSSAAAISIGFERTSAQDVGYGLRQLTDVVVKSLSPGINDPTTAIHAIGHCSALLGDIAAADPGPRTLRDEEGKARVTLDGPSLADLLDLAVSQPRRYGAADPDVLSRLFMLLAELAWSSDVPAHRRAVSDQLGRLRGTVAEQRFDEAERAGLARLGTLVDEALVHRWNP
jgi:uncharacterized membrane protein